LLDAAQLSAQKHPRVQLEPDAIFVADERVWTGVTAGIDPALASIEEDCGREVAVDVGCMLVVYLKPARGQSLLAAHT
jgi:transcriptional regulator GlxA family with amidase domain